MLRCSITSNLSGESFKIHLKFFKFIVVLIEIIVYIYSLYKTPYVDRYLHVDATGNLVKIGKRHSASFRSYPQIYNYFALLANPSITKAENDAHTFQLSKLIDLNVFN